MSLAFDGVNPNSQPIRKAVRGHDGRTLEVHSIFHTIQGEGPFSGRAAVFVRLAGCNLQCPMCDTEYTLGAEQMEVPSIVAAVGRTRPVGGLVVISGGEPFRNNLTPLFEALTDDGYFVQVETNGSLPPSKWNYSLWPQRRQGVYLVCSPKTGRVNKELAARVCCFKYVLSHDEVDPNDGLPTKALNHTANPMLARPEKLGDGSFFQPVYLQPCDAQDDETNRLNAEAAKASALKHGYILQAQIHKLFNLE